MVEKKPKVLFVDDNLFIVENFTEAIGELFDVYGATSGEEALNIFKAEGDFAVVVSDLQMPGMSGVDLLEAIHKLDPDPIRIVISGFMDGVDVIDAINRGRIHQYVLKPWDLAQLRLSIDQAAQRYLLTRENLVLQKQLQQNNRLLHEANQHLKSSEARLRSLSTSLIQAQENEGKRISMELHDELGQSLAALKLQIKVMENEVHASENVSRERVDANLKQLRIFINEIIENVRRLSKNLSPLIIDDLGLDAALEYLVHNSTKPHGIHCTYDPIPLCHLFTGTSEHLVYRMIQEAINNVCKHAQADRLDISIRIQDKQHVKVVLKDNGIGFCVEDVFKEQASSRGLGLATMTERVNMLGGGVDIVSNEGQGTALTFYIPIESLSDQTVEAHG